MAVDLSILIVNWNVRDLLRACLQSLLADNDSPSEGSTLSCVRVEEWEIEVLVVDNASQDGSVEMVQSEFPQVTLIESVENLGFTRGNNLLLRRCRGRYALLLNPDTEVHRDAIPRMLSYAEAHSDVAVVGPRLIYGDGRPQPSRRRFPTLMTAFMESTLLQQWFPHNRWARRYTLADVPADMVQEVDWVTGACMLVRRAAWEEIGLLDEGYFMYSEELDWCRRMVDAGWRVVYLPDAVVTHHEDQSSGQVVAARHIRFQRSKVRYFRKHHGLLHAEVLRAFILGTYLWQLGVETCKYALGHKRPLRRERMAAYVQVLRSGLNTREGA
jgi:N-acetylglucosaminyl-diphospho-decaprenol L-rhamnosyltransferase